MAPDYRRDNPYQQLLADRLENLGVEVSFTAGYRRGLPLWRAWRERGAVGILHLHWLGPYLRGRNLLSQSAYSVRVLADVALVRASGGSVVWTIHNRISHESRWPGLERWLQRHLAARVDRIIVHSYAAVEELRRDLPLPADKTSVIPHGHYRTVYGPSVEWQRARAALGLPESGRVFLCFGMLRPYKGIERLIEEWRNVASLHPDDTLVIAGKSQDAEFLAKLTALAADNDGIQIREGFVPDSQVPIYFSAADLVVLPFSATLTSGSLLLAMSFGKPVIAPRFKTITEAMGAASDLLYDPGDPAGLRNSLEQSANSHLGNLGQRTERECDRLDWGAIAELTLRAYRAALSNRN